MKQIIMDFSPFFVKCALVENGRLAELIIDTPSGASLVGNIYAGKVSDVTKKQFAFVSIGEDKNGLLQLDDNRQRGLSHASKVRGGRVLVQVLRDSTSDKGAMLSATLSFSGRLLVLTKNSGDEPALGVRISSKIISKATREALRELCESFCPEGFGIIVRTEAENADFSAIKREIETLHAEALSVIHRGKTQPMPTLLYGNEKPYTRSLKSLLDAGVGGVITNDRHELDYIKNLAEKYAGVTDIKLLPQEKITAICDIDDHISKLLRQRVWLKSGGYLLIEETQTATYIDVNTGKFAGKKDRSATTAYINIEAAKEIVAQIRLRNISGIIIIDFVGAGSGSEELESVLKHELSFDRAPAIITDWSELNVAILTRKYQRASLRNALMAPCACCLGGGKLNSHAFFADKAYKEIIKIYSDGFCGKMKVTAHEGIAKILEQDDKIRTLAQIAVAKDAVHGFYEISAK